jgi:hypothetical protein
MTCIECDRESDVLAVVNTGRWPERADAELRTHVAACAVCQDVVAVAEAFAEEAAIEPRVPESSLVWLRAQIRAREEATRLAARPITVAQAVAFASVVGVLGALIGASSSWLQTGMRALIALATRIDPRTIRLPEPVAVLLMDHGLLVATIGVSLMITSLTVYLVTREG